METPYRTIFLAPEWQHVRYLGWEDSWPDPDFRVMRQRRGPLARRLVVSAVADPVRFASLLGGVIPGAAEETVVHDLTGDPAIAAQVRAAEFAELGKADRLLNVATLVVPLGQDDDALLAACSADTRRKIRKAQAEGLHFDGAAHADPRRVSQFLACFAAMARDRSLSPISESVVAAMIGGGHARLFAVGDGGTEGDPAAQRSFLLSYETGGTGFFLYGASDRTKQNDGAGHLLQWGAMRAFRDAGHRWYDMGGVPAQDSSDGIFRFKKGFGGILIALGTEYGRHGSLYAAAHRLKGFARRFGR